jgi:hypothetical protein
MSRFVWLSAALIVASAASAQDLEKVQPAGNVRGSLMAVPCGVAREFKLSARDFVTFRDPKWSVLTLMQVGAATADLVTSLNNLNHCASCEETGPSRIFIGRRPDAHKYVIAGIVEISAEALTAHYFRNRPPSRKWYWRMIWTVPQSLSLYEHAQASRHNAAVP